MSSIESKERTNTSDFTDITNSIEKKTTSNQEELANLRASSFPIDSLNEAYHAHSFPADAHCDYTYILTIVDRVKEFGDNRKFYELNHAVEHVLSEIKKFYESHIETDSRLEPIFESLGQYISKHTESIRVLKDSYESLQSISEYSPNSNEESLKTLAESLEQFGDSLEDNIEFIDIDWLKNLQLAMYRIIEESQKKSIEIKPNTKDLYRIRIRNAAQRV